MTQMDNPEIASTSEETEELPVLFPEVVTRTVTITPEMATEWMEKNVNNRALRGATVDAYRRDMEMGRWLLSGANIKFDIYGRLADGQHRLQAAILAKCSFVSEVTWGVDPAAKPVHNAGAASQARDDLGFMGVSHANDVAPMLRRIFAWNPPHNERLHLRRLKVTRLELIAALEEHPEVAGCVHFVKTMNNTAAVSDSLLAFLYWILRQANEAEAQVFITKLATGSDLGAFDPILVLRDRLTKLRTESKASHHEAEVIWLTVIAWNHWMKGNTISKLQFPKGGMTKEGFPVLATVRK